MKWCADDDDEDMIIFARQNIHANNNGENEKVLPESCQESCEA
jgi:hypothetical protein